MHQEPHLLQVCHDEGSRQVHLHQQAAVLGADAERSVTLRSPPRSPSERMCCMIAPFILIYFSGGGKKIKARTSRSGSFPCRLLLSRSEISRMQSLGPVYIPTLSVSRIREEPVTFHPTNQPPQSRSAGGRASHCFWKHLRLAGGSQIQSLVSHV